MAALKTIVGLIGIVLIVSNLCVRQLFYKKRIKTETCSKRVFSPSAKFMISKAVRRKKRNIIYFFNRRLQLVKITQRTKEDHMLLWGARWIISHSFNSPLFGVNLVHANVRTKPLKWMWINVQKTSGLETVRSPKWRFPIKQTKQHHSFILLSLFAGKRVS